MCYKLLIGINLHIVITNIIIFNFRTIKYLYDSGNDVYHLFYRRKTMNFSPNCERCIYGFCLTDMINSDYPLTLLEN